MEEKSSSVMLPYRKQHSISALENHIQIQHDEFIGAESKAQSHIGTSSVVVAIIGGFTLNQPDLGICEKILLAFLILSFCYVFILALLALSPRNLNRAIPINHEKFLEWKKVVYQGKDTAYIEAMFDVYREVMLKNNETLEKKIRWANRARFGVYSELIFALLLVGRLIT